MCLAFGAPTLDAVAEKLADVLEMQPPKGIREKVRGLKKLKSIADSPPKVVSKASARRSCSTGDDVDITRLPIQTLLAGRSRAVHHPAGGDHGGPAARARGTSACTGCR